MPVEHSLEGSQQAGNFQWPGDPDLPEKVVSRISGKQPAEKPDCLLVPGGWIAKLCVHGDRQPTGQRSSTYLRMAVCLYVLWMTPLLEITFTIARPLFWIGFGRLLPRARLPVL